MSSVRPRKTARRDFFDLLWQQPLWAVPFALFFWVLNGARPASFGMFYQASLVFTYAIRLGVWNVAHFVVPRLRIDEDDLPARVRWGIGLYFIAASLVA